ncbi:MAG TPA: hypothetical protein VJQ47_00980 [Steroidobacteraceae bacterium]|nr:hypothetical protein [Steroidobacteraceae bacterium]
MSATKFLSSLPALLGLTGFLVYYFLARHRGGDRITSEIILGGPTFSVYSMKISAEQE